MAYGNNDIEYEAGAPKKADVLIRSTQHIAARQDELAEQTRQIALRLDEAIERFSQNSQDSSYVVQQSGEIFTQLQGENSALKQELLYLAKQSENIYAGLAEKITELSEQAKTREDALTALSDKINDVSEQSAKSGEVYSGIIDRLTELAEQNKRNEKLFTELNEKLESISEHTKKNEKAYGELSDKIVVSEKGEPAEAGSSLLLEKINYISEQLRRSEGAHSMLADKFEILSMRVEQFGFESAKTAPSYNRPVQPVAYPVAAPSEVRAEIDYDKLAEKVAELVCSREVVSPDYIASKVAEQVVIPEVQTANVKVSVDTRDIARQVAELIDEKNAAPTVPVTANVNLDEEGLADRIARKIGGLRAEIAPVSAVADIDEEELAERIANKVGSMRTSVSAVDYNLNEDELADSIALKVGSLKAEDFEILVDDEGCTSISKEIADNLDYNAISNIIADKLRDALDLASVNAPDYEEMAERISEKITVAGINEASIADKAAAALSNYLPEIDTDEIADKVTGAVIDVVNAMPQPAIDTEAICNVITERLIESQEDHDYDVVIDEDGISRITELVNEEIGKGTGARFDKVEEDIARLCDMLTSREETATASEEENAVTEQTAETVEETEAEDKRDLGELCEVIANEIEKGTGARFDKVEDEIAKLAELVSGVVTDGDGEYEEEYEEYGEEDYSAISEVIANEIEKGVSVRLSGIEENVAKITEYLTAEDVEEAEETVDYAEDEETEETAVEDYAELSEIIAAEIEKGVSARLAGVEENIAKVEEGISKINEYIVSESEKACEASDSAEDNERERVGDYTALSEVVATEIEKGVSARLAEVEENIAKVEEGISKINEYLVSETEKDCEVSDSAEDNERKKAEDYTALSEAVAAEVEKGVNSRLSGLEENFNKVEGSLEKISEHIASEQVRTAKGVIARIAALEEHITSEQVRTAKGIVSRIAAAEENIGKAVEENISKVAEKSVMNSVEDKIEVVDDYAALSAIVATEIERGISFRLDGMEENLNKLAELAESVPETKEDGGLIEKVCGDVAEIKEMLANGVAVAETAAANSAPVIEEEAEEEELVTVSDVVETEDEEVPAAEVSAEPVERNFEQPLKEIVRESREYVKEKETVREVLIQPVIVNPYGEPVNGQTVNAPIEQSKQPIDVEEEEVEEEFEEDDEEDGDDDGFSIDVLDMDAFSDDELMPGDLSDYAGGVDFANMMKFKRSFIARIIQSNDEYKQYYGEVKHALLSYKKVNSNVAWGAERFNKGRETIARLKIRGKTLCLYLALDPDNYKTSVYHHLDVSDNKSVAGTPMMVKIKSNLGVRKAKRLIDEMLKLRNGERKEIPERDYAAMYPYETIEDLIEEGLVKDVRKK